jgi:hypothetical protein
MNSPSVQNHHKQYKKNGWVKSKADNDSIGRVFRPVISCGLTYPSDWLAMIRENAHRLA